MYTQVHQQVELSSKDREDRVISYLMSELHDIYSKHRKEIDKKYGYSDGEFWPKTLKELLARLKKGDYKLKIKEVNDEGEDTEIPNYYGFSHIFRFGPDQDKKAFEKAVQALKAKETEVERIIQVKGGEAGLTALTEFESATFH